MKVGPTQTRSNSEGAAHRAPTKPAPKVAAPFERSRAVPVLRQRATAGALAREMLEYAKAAAVNAVVGTLNLAVKGASYPVKDYAAEVPGLPYLTRGSKLPSDAAVETLTAALMRENPELPRLSAQEQAISKAEHAALEGLKQKGFKGIVGLTSERDFDSAAAHQLDVNSLYLPIEDMSTPSRDQVGRFLQFVSNPENQPVYVHCEAGLGRTGVMVGVAQIALGQKTAAQVLEGFEQAGMKLQLANQREFLTLFETLYQSADPALNYSSYGFAPPR